jgi:hypothetical protein
MKKARRREPVEIDFVGAWERLIRRSMVRYGWSRKKSEEYALDRATAVLAKAVFYVLNGEVERLNEQSNLD